MNTIILFLFLLATFAFGNTNNSNAKIFDPRGSLIYDGPVGIQGNQLEISSPIPNGVYFLEQSSNLGDVRKKILVSNSGIKVASFDSAGVTGQAIERHYRASNILRKESDRSSKYFLNTKIMAVNGILNDNYFETQDTYSSFFSFCNGELQESFPEDTIYTKLIFNKSAGGMKADLIQSILIKAEDFGLDMDTIHGWDLLSMNITEYLNNNSVKEPEKIIDLAEFIQSKINEFNEIVETKRNEFNEIIGTNKQTEDALNSAILEANKSKSRVFVLGHSQGGMYTSKAFNSFTAEEQKHYYSFNVAATTDNNPNWYLANAQDKHINLIRKILRSIPVGEVNIAYNGNFEKDYGGTDNSYHTWLESYYNPNLLSYTKINNAVKSAFSSVPYWEKDYSIEYMLHWYDGAATTTIEIAQEDGSFKKLGTYQGYSVTDNTVISVPNPKLSDGLPLLRVKSYHHSRWWGPYLSTDPSFFQIISQANGSYTYLMSDAWSPGSFDDAEFRITLTLVEK